MIFTLPCTIPRSANAASIAAAGWAASIPGARARITPGGVGIDEGAATRGFSSLACDSPMSSFRREAIFAASAYLSS